MATISNPGADGGWSRETAFAVPRADEHAKRFASARRHTRIVRFLRIALPVSAVAVVIVYVATVLQTMGWIEPLPKIALQNMIPENLAMNNPRYQGFNNDGGSYVVTAKTAVQDLTNLSLITLNDITGELVDANKVKTNLKAAHGLFNSKTNELELYDGIDITSDNGMHAKLSRARILTKENVVTSKEPVTVEMPAATITSNEMAFRNKTREVTFLNAVNARIIPKQDPAAAPAGGKAAGTPLIGAGKGPIDILSNRLDIDDLGKVATFSGAVHATQGDTALETASLAVSYESQNAAGRTAAGNAAKSATPMGDGAKIRRIVSSTPVVMTRAPDDRVTGNSLDFDARNEVAVLTGNVMMTSGADRQVSGNVATIDQKADTVLLTGNVVAIQGRNELSGERLFIDRANARTQLTSPAAPGASEPGRIKTRFYRNEANGGSRGKEWQTALGTGAKAAVFKTDPNAPIDVEADRLDVDDRAKNAVFKGDVHAKQGDFLVRTSELRAFYTGQAGLNQAAPGAPKQKSAQLTRIEARGKVIVTSKNGQNATGDWANFDVTSNKVTLGGDVVLTQGKNIVRGTRLLIDMVTGESIIQNDPGSTAAWTAEAAPKTNPTDTGFVVQRQAGSTRPSAIFYPRRKEHAPAAKTPDTQSPSGSAIGGGWEASSPAP
jgi:lipopolysaccharide transport protein LptA/LPS export ABC transporter protein LptC